MPLACVLRDGQIRIRPEVQSRGYFDIKLRAGALVLTAGKYVGLIPINDEVIIDVEPKMPAANMLHILARTDGRLTAIESIERAYRPATARPWSVLDIFGEALAKALRQIEVEGLAKEYQQVEASGSGPKGQVRFGESIRRHWARGYRHVAVSAHFDLTADIEANRLIGLACEVLIEDNVKLRRRPSYLPMIADFADLLSNSAVPLDKVKRAVPMLERLSPAYAQACSLSRAIVLGQGIELPAVGGEVTLPSLLVDMETLFENYVREVLASGLVGYLVLDGNSDGARPLFDDRQEPVANPDVVIRDDVDAAFIGEVKYKRSEAREDLNQVLAYSLSYRARTIVLFLPAEAAATAGLLLVGEVGGTRVYRYRFDLSSSDISGEEQRMIETILELLKNEGAVVGTVPLTRGSDQMSA